MLLALKNFKIVLHAFTRKSYKFDIVLETLEGGINKRVGDQQIILIWDEFPNAVEADKSLPSYLQAAWDYPFKDKYITLILAGSHIGMMVDQMQYNAPLYGRFFGQLPIDAMPFGALQDFFPGYGPDKRVPIYATPGGVPAYLERFNKQLDFSANIRSQISKKPA